MQAGVAIANTHVPARGGGLLISTTQSLLTEALSVCVRLHTRWGRGGATHTQRRHVVGRLKYANIDRVVAQRRRDRRRNDAIKVEEERDAQSVVMASEPRHVARRVVLRHADDAARSNKDANLALSTRGLQFAACWRDGVSVGVSD
jgi:hypothetical protein